ncbi:hypothetical protein BRETT_001188 [Brettanomyces bruxellensis]|uniref:NAD-dependent epimerase/dehydratase domain-containing protein n=1 Tax=Dekkera bruxellensis TaxID=5007 RepID=A0A871R9U7_DEKBR|nr:uncharacterized protein BRETT_001188 [Brettanomyces bruxellensis]QOU21464.1 hypothetical protein BRETT_001188 [Brettanomyces bruxellensis]
MALKIFVTGATGTIGSVTVDRLLENGIDVLGLARSEDSAAKLKAKHCQVLRGSLEDLAVLRKGASECDGVIHLAFVHDFANFNKSVEIDRNASSAMMDSLRGTGKPFISISGTLMLEEKNRSYVDEDSPFAQSPGFSLRAENEKLVLSYATEDVKSMSVRFPPTVHGVGDTVGFIPTLVAASKKAGFAMYIDQGENCWPAVNLQDAADFLRLAILHGTAGKPYNCVGESGIPTKAIAEAIGKKYNLPVKSITKEESFKYLGFLATILAANNVTRAEKSKKELEWTPSHSTLLEDIASYY